MKTVTLQVGNSDDKLAQMEWAAFVARIRDVFDETPYVDVHFFGCSNPTECWQNACWVFVADPGVIEQIKSELIAIRAKYRQDSVAWTEGETAFI